MPLGWRPTVQTAGDLRHPEQRRGSYSPFYLRIDREDGEQEITGFATDLPPGLTANLTGIPFCPEADIEASKEGKRRRKRKQNPSCPAASEIGHTIVEAGVGTVLAQTPGKIYLAGPVQGARSRSSRSHPRRSARSTSAPSWSASPLDINPDTGQSKSMRAASDQIPHIIDGIVIHVRDIRVYIEREKFILNPTNCNPMTISETSSARARTPPTPPTSPGHGRTTPFEAADCSSLEFEPDSRSRPAPKQAVRTARASPRSSPSPARSALRLTSAASKSNSPSNFPPASRRCRKRAPPHSSTPTPPGARPRRSSVTPRRSRRFCPVPLEGPAYFVSHGGEAFPDLEIVLQGYGFTIVLTATRSSAKPGSPAAPSRPSPTSLSRASNSRSPRAPTAR